MYWIGTTLLIKAKIWNYEFLDKTGDLNEQLWRKETKMDAIKEYLRAVDKLEHGEINLGEYDELCKPLRDVRENVHGKWIDDILFYYDDGCPCIVTRCSNCGEIYWTYNYCPNCGARMDGDR